MDGILPVYKPVGMTSYDVIREFKRIVHPDFKIGHGGTLDPFANGVLLLLLGKATKKMNELMELPKMYRAVARLGARSDTLDCTGTIEDIPTNQQTSASMKDIKQATGKFVGEIEQEIPDYSAAKINGQPRYRLARRGEMMEKKSKIVTLYSLTIESIGKDFVTFTATVSSGTYIRQLSYDIFKSMGIESYLEALTRTKIDDFNIEKCCQINDFQTEKWKTMMIQ
ncbi:MAG: tRNA pseudouridine(55) synthase TruB [bacterium]